MSTQEAPAGSVIPVNRWIQLVAGVVCMVMIANLQYGWTYFVDPIDARFHWGRTNIQIAFTIFVATETCPSRGGSSIGSGRASSSCSAAPWSRSPGG